MFTLPTVPYLSLVSIAAWRYCAHISYVKRSMLLLHCKPEFSREKILFSCLGDEIPKAIATLSPAPGATQKVSLGRVTILNRFPGNVLGHVWMSAVKLD